MYCGFFISMPLTAYHIAEVWPFVKDRLETICREQGADFQPEDIYRECETGKAFLYTTDEDDSFAVIRPQWNRYTGENTLYVIAGWGHQEKHMEKLMELARGVGATKIEMRSKRRGFERTGWSLDYISYSREVEHG